MKPDELVHLNPWAELGESKQNSHGKELRMAVVLGNLAITIAIMTTATLLSFTFRYFDFHESNIIMVYILGVLFVAKQTDGYVFGIAASIIGVLTFNYFFTEPYYSFDVYRPDYPITFAIMLIVAIITSTLTSRVKHESMLASQREKRAEMLCHISKGLLKARSLDQIAEIGGKDIAELFARSIIVTCADSPDSLQEPYIIVFDNDARADVFKSHEEMQAALEARRSGKAVGAGTDIFVDSAAYYLPIKGQSGIIGVLGVSCFDGMVLSGEQKTFMETVATQLALAMERERLSEKQQESKMNIEREKLRGNLLRSISHDLRTPLTGILGAAATIIDNDEILDNRVKRELMQNIYEDTSWLIHSVENILSLTRIDDENFKIKKTAEAVEEIVAEAVARTKNLVENHILKINIPDDLILLPMDGTLIEQVMVNLIDNAVKYTPYGSTIEIKVWLEDDKGVFEVSDNGTGIPEESIPMIFKRFYSAATTTNTGRRGTGLGLTICKSIVDAHDGEISAFNNSAGGATFQFVLPVRE